MSEPRSDILNLRRSARYVIRRTADVRAHIHADDGQTVYEETCAVADISMQGVKLKSVRCLPIKQPLQIQVQVPACNVKLELVGNVCWCRPCDQQYWWIGVSLHHEIPHSLLDRLAVGGVIERRGDRRLSVNADAQVRFELGADTFPATILDLSQGGFAVLTAGVAQVGDRILLMMREGARDSAPISGRVCWLRAEQDHTIYGCEFLSSTASAEVRAQLSRHDDGRVTRRCHVSSLPTRCLWPVTVAFSLLLLTLPLNFPTGNERAPSFPIQSTTVGTSGERSLEPFVSAGQFQEPTLEAHVNVVKPFELPSERVDQEREAIHDHPLNQYVDWLFEQLSKPAKP